MFYSSMTLGLHTAFDLYADGHPVKPQFRRFLIIRKDINYRQMPRIKIHLRVFLYAVIFGMIAYGIVQAAIVLHRFLIS